MKCKHYGPDGACALDLETTFRGYCHEGPCTQFAVKVNADTVRAMVIDELAQLLAKGCPDLAARCPWLDDQTVTCSACWAAWLRTPVKEAVPE